MANVTYKVKKGDTLSGIAKTYKTTVAKLAALNNIKNVDKIYIGETLIISGVASSAPKSSSNKATIKRFGLQSNADNTLFATWVWDKDHTKEYKVQWFYDTGNGVWFVGDDSTTTHKQSTYSVPSNAKRVKFKVKPISTTHKVNKKETNYWKAEWSNEKVHSFDVNPPLTPSVPEVKIENYTLTATLDNLNVNGTMIQFQIVKNNKSVFKTINTTITKGHASCSCSITKGNEYKVRARSCKSSLALSKNTDFSDWSEYSSNVGTGPAAPSGITKIYATSSTSVYIEWPNVSNANSYELEYATEQRYFDGSDKVQSVTGIKFNHYEKTGLENGNTYYFRVRAVNDDGESTWSNVSSIILGKKPSSPTTWSSTTTCVVGETLNLYWVHNSEDGSSQTFAELELDIGGVKTTKTIANSTDEDLKDKTSVYSINTSQYAEGVEIKWRVRTAGILKDSNGNPSYGEWSIQRVIDIYAPPTLEIEVKDADENLVETLTHFPFYITTLAGPSTQTPVSYNVSVVSNTQYETIDEVGNQKIVNAGDSVYSKFFDVNNASLIEMSAGNIDLENNISYTVTVIVSMNSGLTAEASSSFTVSWEDEEYEPNAEIGIDDETLTAHIKPYCTYRPTVYYLVTVDSKGNYVPTKDTIDEPDGTPMENTLTTTGHQVYSYGNIYYYIGEGEETLVKDITLSVYRREFDGTFTEIATGLQNELETFVTDPHPSLDYARYRVVAITNSTGAVSYYDVPGYPIGVSGVIIQWDEQWSNFNIVSEDEMEEPTYSGSLLKLPYNIDVSDKHSADVSLVEYIGRKHPVSYYGTQLGESSTWNVEIDKEDKETLYALRRLAIWMGDVYVREPSGSGYWANINVSFNQKHCAVTIPVTFEITRVEGGI